MYIYTVGPCSVHIAVCLHIQEVYVLPVTSWLHGDAKSSYKIPKGCRHIVSQSLRLKGSLKTLSVIGKNKHVKQANTEILHTSLKNVFL